MRARRIGSLLPVLFLIGGAACSADGGSGPADSARPDARTDASVDGRYDVFVPPTDVGPCADDDGDHISNLIEGTADPDGDGTPNRSDDDADGDGFSDLAESNRNYPGFESAAQPELMCGRTPDNCDDDSVPNFLDLDSDNDGLTDAEEREARTNPCSGDTDGDGVPDLTERVAGSDPTMASSLPPAEALYVTLPYSTAEMPQPHVHREFEFQTRIRAADIFFLVDTTGSMQSTIDALRTTLTTRIIPGVAAALMGGDARYGVGDFRDVPNGSYGASTDWIVRVRQRLDPMPDLSLAAVRAMTARFGGDWPEAQVEALYQVLEGEGIAGHEDDRTPALAMGGEGWAGVMMPGRDCPAEPGVYGWGCFREGRVPIIVLFSDADWHNGPGFSYPYSGIRGLHSYNNVRDAMLRRGAYFVGIDVGATMDTYGPSQRLARETNTLDAMGNPIVFNNPGGGPGIADSVVNAITTLANQTRQNVTTRTEPDASEMRIVAGRTTADFIKAVTPVRGIPDAPTGYDRHDTTTFYNVAPSTRVVFDVDFFNDFQPGAATAQLFRATIIVLGRAGSEVDRRPVFIIVPAANATTPPG